MATRRESRRQTRSRVALVFMQAWYVCVTVHAYLGTCACVGRMQQEKKRLLIYRGNQRSSSFMRVYWFVRNCFAEAIKQPAIAARWGEDIQAGHGEARLCIALPLDGGKESSVKALGLISRTLDPCRSREVL